MFCQCNFPPMKAYLGSLKKEANRSEIIGSTTMHSDYHGTFILQNIYFAMSDNLSH